MPVDGGGVITRPASPIPVDGQDAQAAEVNVPVNDIYNIMNMLMFLDGRKSLRGNIPMNGYKASNAANATDPQDYVTLAQMQAAISAVSLPRGALIPMTGTAVPESWVVANGQTLLRSTFPAFWAWVQTSANLAATEGAKTVGQYGPGDGSTTFTVPNLYADNGYFIRPISTGRTIGTVQQDDNKSHDHSGSTGAAGSHFHTTTATLGGAMEGGNAPRGNYAASGGITSTAPDHTHSIPPQGATEARPKNIAYPVLIKT